MNRRIAVAAGGTALGTALVLSGCNADGSSGGTTGTMKLSANEALLKSSQKTGEADTFKADLTVTGKGGGGGKVHATGQFRLRPELRFSARLDQVSSGGKSVPLQGQAIFTGNTLYAKMPQLAQFVSGGKSWVKVDVNQVQQSTGFDVKGVIDQIEQVNPAAQTKMFTGSKDVEQVGTETVDGVKTTHYAGTVTVQEALKQLDAQTRDKVKRWFPESNKQAGKISFDLWTDGQNLPRKLVSKGAGSQGAGTVTVVYSDYGTSFSANPPPSDQVGKLSLNRFLGGGN